VPSPGDSDSLFGYPPLKRWAIIFRARGARIVSIARLDHIAVSWSRISFVARKTEPVRAELQLAQDEAEGGVLGGPVYEP